MPSMRLLLERFFPKALGSSRSRLQDQPVDLSTRRWASKGTNGDAVSKIMRSREYRVEYGTDAEFDGKYNSRDSFG
jgi:hypothetical protein